MAGAKRIRISNGCKESLKLVLARAITQNQLLILSEIDGREVTITSLLRKLSVSHNIPLSTLKLNAKRLRELNLITNAPLAGVGNGRVLLTEAGRLILGIVLER